MARSRSDRLAEALGALEETYGPVPVVSGGDSMDQFVALFLYRENGSEPAREAVARLREEFVDWNEVRISWAREVAEPLAAAGYDDPKETATALLAFLDTIYRDRNAVNLGYFESMEPEDAFAWIRSLEGVGDGTAAAVTSLFLPEGQILAVPEILRIAGRVGVAGKNATPAKTRKALEDVAIGDEKVRMHHLFARHSEDICRSRSPKCAECTANQVCDYGKAQGLPPPEKPAAPEPKKAEAGTKKKSRATATKKKPAAKKKASGGARKSAKKPAGKAATPSKKKPAKKKTTTRKAASKKAPAKKKTAGKKAASKKKSATGKKAATKKKAAPARKKPAKKAAAKKAPAKKKAAPKKKASPPKKSSAKKRK